MRTISNFEAQATQGWVPRWRWCTSWMMGVGTTAGLYACGAMVRRAPHVLPECGLDRLIGFHPSAVGLYLSFFVLQAMAFCWVPGTHRRALTKSFMVCAAVALIVFVLWPTTLVQPSANDQGWAMGLVRWFDTPANCLPSLHAALSAVSAFALGLRRQRWVTIGVWCWALAICWSAIATRQHLSVDIITGWLLGCGVAVWFLIMDRTIKV